MQQKCSGTLLEVCAVTRTANQEQVILEAVLVAYGNNFTGWSDRKPTR